MLGLGFKVKGLGFVDSDCSSWRWPKQPPSTGAKAPAELAARHGGLPVLTATL